MATNIVLSNQEFKVVGTRPIRHDGEDKVTGRAKYGADFQSAGLLHGKVLRSPHAHAIIKSVDTSKAESFPGVKAVLTGKDMPVNFMDSPGRGAQFASDNIMARSKVLYRGHPVAAVAAINQHVAEEAVALIVVVYEVLTPVMDVREAMKD
ncbi:MAG TPA: xanthine dehydrogenase family protein molybdopterin-binding subunit, partial [Dehalococcoidia bacterium]|nr:xanthine dehydrogenase family protein molybdopterin-binding subunit [Dehalococcoidia bacterium]